VKVKTQNSPTVWASLIAAGMLLGGTAAPALAQDVRTQVAIARDTVGEVVRSAVRAVHDAIGQDLGREMGREIGRTIREATSGLDPFGRSRVPRAAVQNRAFRATQESRETKTVKLGTSGALELRNIGGDIVVSAGSGADAVIEIVRVSHGRTDADAKTGLDRVTVDVSQVGDRATVRTRYVNERDPVYSVDVAYRVKAPTGTRLTISSVGGDITVSDIRGETSTSTTGGSTTITNGRVSSAKSVGGDVSLTGTETDGTLEVETLGGKILLKQIKARRLNASNVGGDIVVQGSSCEAVDLGSTGGDVEFGGPLVKGGRYELHTFGGSVQFSPSGGVGYELQASTFSGEVRTEGVTVQMQGAVTARAPNRSVRGTVGDGSALVVLRTFSGGITVGRRR